MVTINDLFIATLFPRVGSLLASRGRPDAQANHLHGIVCYQSLRKAGIFWVPSGRFFYLSKLSTLFTVVAW